MNTTAAHFCRAPLAATALLLVSTAAHGAYPVHDPDWPCQAIRISQLSLPALWNGPDVAPYAATWSQDQTVAALVSSVAERRLPLDKAEQAIRDFAASAGPHKRSQLLAVMAGLFSTLNAERAQVIAGLDRFGLRQKELAAEIRGDMTRLRTEQAATSPDAGAEAKPNPLSDQINWETRVFEQRRQTIRYACAVPDTIEQRLFALARTISEALGQPAP